MPSPSNRPSGSTQQRLEEWEQLCARLTEEGFVITPHIIPIARANILALVLAGPPVLVLLLLFRALWPEQILDKSTCFGILVLFVACTFLHECLHGLAWSRFCPNGLRDVHLGFLWKSLTPYCACRHPLPPGPYLLGTLLPGLLLGVGVCAVSLVVGSWAGMVLGSLNFLAAGGDLAIALEARHCRGCTILDHPNQAGFYTFHKPDRP